MKLKDLVFIPFKGSLYELKSNSWEESLKNFFFGFKKIVEYTEVYGNVIFIAEGIGKSFFSVIFFKFYDKHYRYVSENYSDKKKAIDAAKSYLLKEIELIIDVESEVQNSEKVEPTEQCQEDNEESSVSSKDDSDKGTVNCPPSCYSIFYTTKKITTLCIPFFTDREDLLKYVKNWVIDQIKEGFSEQEVIESLERTQIAIYWFVHVRAMVSELFVEHVKRAESEENKKETEDLSFEPNLRFLEVEAFEIKREYFEEGADLSGAPDGLSRLIKDNELRLGETDEFGITEILLQNDGRDEVYYGAVGDFLLGTKEICFMHMSREDFVELFELEDLQK